MKKRFLIMIALLCCLVLAAGILAACNSNEGTQTGGQTPGGSTPGIGDNDEVYRTVTFDLNGGDGSLAPREYVVGELMVLPTPTRDGFRFIGWQDASGREYDDSTAMPDKNLTLYAQWEATAGIISVEGGTIDGEEIFMLVESSVDIVSLASRVKCAEGMIWRLYHDSLGQQEIPTKIAAGSNGRLKNGDNVFYIVVTSTDATQVSVYSLTIHRSYAASVRFYDGDELLYTDTAYTGYEYTPDYVPEISGYTFNYWETADGNKCTSFIPWGSVSLYANKTINTYKATLRDDYDANVNGKEISVTHGETFVFPVPQRSGYSFLGWYVGDEQLTSSDGRSLDVWSYTSDQTVTAKWQINSYAVALQINISGAGELSGEGNYEYASIASIKAKPYLGYEFTGWYDGDKLLSKQPSYTFSLPAMDVNYTAKFAVKDEMSNFSFTSAFDACTITGTKDKSVTDITIPDSVTSIGEYAFSGCSGLTSVTIGGSVTSIGDYAFYGCSSLTSVTIGGSVTSIGEYAFYNCTALTSVTIPDSVTSIGEEAFYNCTALTSVTIPDSVTSIGEYAFYNCTALTSVTIPDSVTSIGEYAFSGCSGLTAVTIGNSVTSIGDYAFGACSSLESITIPFVGASKDGTSNTHFGYIFGASEYYYNDGYVPASLKEVIITGGTSIGSGAFYGCTGLTSITIPDSVTSIGESAFEGCRGLTSVTIPDSVTSIGEEAFYNCSGLTSVTIGGSVTSIEYCAFYNCTALTSVTIPDSVTSIGEYAFSDCSGLTAVTIGGSVTSIGDSAFNGCSSLTSITIPDSVTSIGEFAFSGCSGLTAVTIGKGVTSIGDSAFQNCSSLTAVYITDLAAWCGIEFGSATANPLYCANNLYLSGELVTDLVIPDSVTSIGEYAFYNCTALTAVTIGNSVTSIGDYAFGACSSLESITIPFVGATKYGTENTLFGYIFGAWRFDYNDDCVPASLKEVIITGGTRIDDYAFSGCSGLTSVTIPDSVTSIGGSAFSGCSGLTSVAIGNGVTSIGDYAFYNCSGLTSIYYTGNMESWLGKSWQYYVMSDGRALYLDGTKVEGEIDIPNGTTSIPSYAFAYQTDITSVTIPDSVTSIGGVAFSECSGLTSVTIGNGVTSIGGSAFSGCTGLTSITIPDSVTSIGKSAFSGCSGLTSITIPDSVTSIWYDAFEGCNSLTSVTFEVTTGWYASGFSLSSSSLADPATAAEWLRWTYNSYYWKRNV